MYCIVYGLAGALIGMAASVALSGIEIEAKDDVYAEVATNLLPIGIGGLVLAAAVAAMMSTASGALIAAATVARADVLPFVAGWFGKTINTDDSDNPEHDVKANRYWVLGLGIVAIIIAISTKDVVAALTIAYDILVGGLLVAIIGGLVWKRGTGIAAAASMAVGSVITLGTMIILEINAKAPLDGIYANEPIYYGLIASAIVYVAVSLFSKPTDPAVMKAWTDRVAGTRVAEEELSHRPSKGTQRSNARRRRSLSRGAPLCRFPRQSRGPAIRETGGSDGYRRPWLKFVVAFPEFLFGGVDRHHAFVVVRHVFFLHPGFVHFLVLAVVEGRIGFDGGPFRVVEV